MSVPRSQIARNLARIRGEIVDAARRARRDPGEVGLVAVTKSVGVEEIVSLLQLGITDIAESRVQQLVARAAEVDDLLARRAGKGLASPRWHLVGHLQRNKAKVALGVAAMIHSVDSLRLAEELNSRASQDGRTIDVLLQVNCSQERQKHGCAVGAGMHLAELITTLRSLRLVGLMTMAPLSGDPERARPAFTRLRELFEEMRHEKVGGEAFRHLSMGMSQDYPVAVEEGATILRIGSALFE